MRIGIITIQKCNNFGAELQAYALQKKLQLMGYDAENIDYVFYKNPAHRKTNRSRPSFKLSLVNRVKELLFPILKPFKANPKFEKFVSEHIKLSKSYVTMDALYADPPKYDVYVVGSDQVWNPRTASNLEPYFLTFAPKGSRKISYASSFGVRNLPPSAYLKFSQWLEDFEAISVREEAGKKLAKNFAFCVEPECVVDPTLLLTAEDWSQVTDLNTEAQRHEGGYVLLYDLIASDGAVELARKWAKKLGVEVVRIGDGDYGPAEFVSLFANAKAVVTTSFHGTAFSTIFQKPFYSVIPKGMTNASRIESLVGALGVSNRLLREVDLMTLEPSEEGCETREALKSLRGKSEVWLKTSVEGTARAPLNRIPIKSYAAWARDKQARAQATSGGAFGVLAEEVLARGGVVFGAAWTADFKRVRHIGVETKEGLEALKRSKYVWSDPSAAYKEIPELLKQGREVLFSGTPCQCAAVRALGKEGKLTTIDFVCHGTPEPESFAKYAEALEAKFGSSLVDYHFRDKRDGWNFQRVSYRFANGVEKRVIPWLDEYFRSFSLNSNLRKGCFSCPFAGLNRPSDLTIADCWRVGASNPEWDDNRGTSNVLVNTERGAALWSAAVGRGEMEVHEYDLRLAQMRNHSLMEPSKRGGRAKPLLYYWAIYWLKRLGWAYFKCKQ